MNKATRIILGAIISVICGYGVYWIVAQVWLGYTSKDIWLLAGGGIFLFFFGSLLVAGVGLGLFWIAVGMDWV